MLLKVGKFRQFWKRSFSALSKVHFKRQIFCNVYRLFHPSIRATDIINKNKKSCRRFLNFCTRFLPIFPGPWKWPILGQKSIFPAPLTPHCLNFLCFRIALHETFPTTPNTTRISQISFSKEKVRTRVSKGCTKEDMGKTKTIPPNLCTTLLLLSNSAIWPHNNHLNMAF